MENKNRNLIQNDGNEIAGDFNDDDGDGDHCYTKEFYPNEKLNQIILIICFCIISYILGYITAMLL